METAAAARGYGAGGRLCDRAGRLGVSAVGGCEGVWSQRGRLACRRRGGGRGGPQRRLRAGGPGEIFPRDGRAIWPRDGRSALPADGGGNPAASAGATGSHTADRLAAHRGGCGGTGRLPEAPGGVASERVCGGGLRRAGGRGPPAASGRGDAAVALRAGGGAGASRAGGVGLRKLTGAAGGTGFGGDVGSVSVVWPQRCAGG